ncbi:hypothetical protein NMG60_11033588 [Bertholletia excelsa]
MAPGPKKSFFPLILIFSLSALFLFSLYRSPSPSTSTSHLSLSPLQSSSTFVKQKPSNPPLKSSHEAYGNFSLTVKVLAYDRLASLSRCLRSLANAHYGHDRVNLHIFIDHFKIIDAPDNVSLYLDQKLNESHQILDFVDGFHWRFGEKMVHYRTGNVGLQAQWLEAWWPSSDDEFVFVVEDDLEVSPLYYKFLKGLIVNYYYNSSNFSPSIYGASLQRPRFVPGKHGNKLKLESGTHVFLYQLVGTWGQLLFPRPWKEFRLWYDIHKARGIKPFLEGMVTNGWYKKMGERIWTPWFIKFIHSHGYFNLYTNFSNERALSRSHRDAGVNYGKTAGPDSYLLDENSLDFNLLEMQPLSKLKWYDFCFRQVLPNRVVSSFHELGSVLQSLEKVDTVLLVSLAKVSQTFARNLLCHFERLNIRNYILTGPKSDFLLDLARRGHLVIDMDQFLDSLQDHKLIGYKHSRRELITEVFVKAYVVEKTLELGYNTLILNGNVIPASNDLIGDVIDTSYDFYVVGMASNILFVRSSSSAKKNWAMIIKSFKGKELISEDEINLVYRVKEVLGQKGVKGIDEMSFGLNAANVSQTALADGNRMVFWSWDMGMETVQKRLEELGLWMIDSDSSCAAVVCHRS